MNLANCWQHSPASYGREVAKSDFIFDLSKCFFQLFFEFETPAEPHPVRFRGLVNIRMRVCENFFSWCSRESARVSFS